MLIALAYVRRWRWAGFAETRTEKIQDKDVQPAKTLWDWLQLLVIPVALAALAFLLNNSQSSREQRREDERAAGQQAIAADATQEDTLRAYLAQMSDLILDRNLLRSQPVSDVRAVARTVTLTTLRRLDGERKGVVVRFLAEAGAIDAGGAAVELADANLRSAELREALLFDTDLTYADLRGAHLRGARLGEGNLLEADLRGADLRDALLIDENLNFADLRGADLRGANLSGAPFFGANPRQACDRAGTAHVALLGEAKLHGADLRGTDLRRLDLTELNFSGAKLGEACLRYADLGGADLRRALGLRHAFLSGAKYDSNTRWPSDFDPAAAGARKSD